MNAPNRPPLVVIIGAARSGTRILRAALAAHPDILAVPHDINFVWKWGRWSQVCDELDPTTLEPRTRERIRRFVYRFRRGDAGKTLIEKTVSNTVRVPFVRAVFPEAHYIHLIRDGRAVAESVRRQFKAPLETKHVLSKLRYFPPQALTYAVDYLRVYAVRTLRKQESVSKWGVEVRDLDQIMRSNDLLLASGVQWARCVDAALEGLAMLPEERVHTVAYEDLVQSPVETLSRLLKATGLGMHPHVEHFATTSIRASDMSKWTRVLVANEIEQLEDRIGGTLRRAGYTLTTSTAD